MAHSVCGNFRSVPYNGLVHPPQAYPTMNTIPSHAPRLAVLLSGTGRTLDNLLARIDFGELNASVRLVIASAECRGAQIARSRGIETMVIPGTICPDVLAAMLRERGIAWIILAGYLRLLPIPPGFRNRVVNIHPALLPSFGGEGMHGLHVHEAVLNSGTKTSGCTVHLCDDEYDHGPILAQAECPVLPGDTPETLAERVFELEKSLYPSTLAKLFAQASVPAVRARNSAT